jgi:aminoglycoside phosphotransferase (APT) family kinase protein
MTSLEQLLTSHFGARVTEIASRPSLYCSSFFVNEIDVRLDDGTTVALVAKAAQWEAKSPDAQRAKPGFLWDEQRERTTYESILAALDLNSAQYFGSYTDASGVHYLLLERIPGIRLWECGDFESWRAAARWLARLHGQVSTDTAMASTAGPHLLRYDRQFYESWMTRAQRFHVADDDVNRLATCHARVVDRLLEERPAFLHGEFYSENILVESQAGAVAVRPVDWEMAAFGPALMDLACLVAGEWNDDERADMTDAYLGELATAGFESPRREEYLQTLDCCLFHLSIQNLGWSDAWTPPPDRAHDWLGEAVRLCEKWKL